MFQKHNATLTYIEIPFSMPDYHIYKWSRQKKNPKQNIVFCILIKTEAYMYVYYNALNMEKKSLFW